MHPRDTELEDLLTESTASSSDPLEDLLAESLTAAREKEEAELARKRRQRGMQSPAEAAADAERIRRWEMAQEWRAIATVAVFERYTCACGRQQTIFRQLMSRQQHRRQPTSLRWQQIDSELPGLPRESVIQDWSTPMCTECSDKSGFPFQLATEWR